MDAPTFLKHSAPIILTQPLQRYWRSHDVPGRFSKEPVGLTPYGSISALLGGSKPPACSFRAAFVRFRLPVGRQVALKQEKIIKNRLETLKSDRLLLISQNAYLIPGEINPHGIPMAHGQIITRIDDNHTQFGFQFVLVGLPKVGPHPYRSLKKGLPFLINGNILRPDGYLPGILHVFSLNLAAVAEPVSAGPDPCDIEEILEAHKIGHKDGPGVAVDQFGGVVLLNLALIHDGHLVGDGEAFLLVVGNEDGGNAELLLHALNLGPHLNTELSIEIGEGFVQEEQLRRDNQSPGQSDPLPLTTAQVLRFSIPQRKKVDCLEHIQNLLLNLFRGTFLSFSP